MTMILTWVDNKGYIKSSTLRGTVMVKPIFSFVYDSLYYEPDDGNLFYIHGTTSTPLLSSQIAEIQKFIDAYTEDLLPVMGVDANGKYVGHKQKRDVARTVSAPPPDPENWTYDFNINEFVYTPPAPQVDSIPIPPLTLTEAVARKELELRDQFISRIASVIGTSVANLHNHEAHLTRLAIAALDIKTTPDRWYGKTLNGTTLPYTKNEILSVAENILIEAANRSLNIEQVISEHNQKLVLLANATSVDQVNSIT